MSSPTSVSGDPPAPGEPEKPLEHEPSLLEREVPPMIRRAQEAFRRDLPQLLDRHRNQWVAYHGDRRVAVGRSKRDLYQRCLRDGIPEGEFVVRSIEPDPDGFAWEELVSANPPVYDSVPPEVLEQWSLLLKGGVPPLIQRAQEAFRRDLPQLLERHKHRWVAYHGDRRVALGRSKRDLYQRCVRDGIPENEFVVRKIEHELPDEFDWEEFRDI